MSTRPEPMTLAKRLRELAHAVTLGKEAIAREFTMRVPAEPERDADLVLSEAADLIERIAATAPREVDETEEDAAFEPEFPCPKNTGALFYYTTAKMMDRKIGWLARARHSASAATREQDAGEAGAQAADEAFNRHKHLLAAEPPAAAPEVPMADSDWGALFTEVRDNILHGRGNLDGVLDNDQTNAVLDELDRLDVPRAVVPEVPDQHLQLRALWLIAPSLAGLGYTVHMIRKGTGYFVRPSDGGTGEYRRGWEDCRAAVLAAAMPGPG